ncbi:hypothetical protein PENSPDRAFT_655378 [Peniophora sp. CONT]|nr:hypothetical protein PENSPDRAFT_655378 [Peniophora sp. CONT]
MAQDQAQEDQTFWANAKLVHVVAGIYFWEWFTSLPYEWEVITGKRRSVGVVSFVVYMLIRTLTMLFLVTSVVAFNITTLSPSSCAFFFHFISIIAALTLLFCALLIAFRAVALWKKNWLIISWMAAVWCLDVASTMWEQTMGRPTWSEDLQRCNILNTQAFRVPLLIDVIANMLLLATMLLGVWRQKNETNLWRLLNRQGWSWLVVALLCEIPSVVLNWVNISAAWNVLFQTPHLVTLVIVCTRIHRGLVVYMTDFNEGESQSVYQHRQRPSEFEFATPVQVNVCRTVRIDVESEYSPRESAASRPTSVSYSSHRLSKPPLSRSPSVTQC